MKKLGCDMVTLTIAEWLNWIATGHLRLDDKRIAVLKDDEDAEGFHRMMSVAPDVAWNDDAAYVLAELKRDWKAHYVQMGMSEKWLGLQAVLKFAPVSEPGGKMLQFEAERANVSLASPFLQPLWEQWTQKQFEARADWRGRLLGKTLGLNAACPETIPEELRRCLQNIEPLPTASKLDKLRGSYAYGWAAAFSCLGILLGDDEKQRVTKKFGLNPVIQVLKQAKIETKPFLQHALLGTFRN